MRAAVEEDAVGDGLHLGVDFVHQLLAGDGGAQKGLKNRQQRLGFVEGECAVGHGDRSILTQAGVPGVGLCLDSLAALGRTAEAAVAT